MVRAGVEFDDLSNALTYEEVFNLGEKLTDLLWFFSVLSISGSEDRLKGFMFPLDAYYMGKVKDKYFEDYLLYRSGYMCISASDYLARQRIKNTDIEKPEEVEAFEEDDFIEQEVNEQEEDTYSSWGEDDDFIEQDVEELDEPEDDYGTWGNSEDDDFIEQDTEEEEEDEDTYGSWGNSEEEDDFIEQDSEDDEDNFGNWGNNEDDEDFVDQEVDDDEDSYSSWGSGESEVEDEGEDAYGSWGSEDYEDGEDNSEDEDYLDEEDDFSSWGNSDEEEDTFEDGEEELEDEDAFGSWGNQEEEDNFEEDDTDLEEDDTFSSWGSNSDEEDVDLDDDCGNGVSGCNGSLEGETGSRNTTSIAKTKYDYERESNVKTAQAIEMIANGILTRGGILKSKVVDRLKNSGENSDS